MRPPPSSTATWRVFKRSTGASPTPSATATVPRHVAPCARTWQRVSSATASLPCGRVSPAEAFKAAITSKRRRAMKRVLLTGAAGDIGRRLRGLLPPIYPQLRLSDVKRPADLRGEETFVAAELGDLAEVERAVDGCEGIIHLGGHSVEGSWETILNANIIGCRNLFEAARRKGVQRVVFASSNHAVGFYPRVQRIGSDVTVRPDTRYGLSKAFGEALGALYADKFGLRVLCLRIGNLGDRPLDQRRLSIWLSPDDLVQLIRIGLEHPDLEYEIFYGASL